MTATFKSVWYLPEENRWRDMQIMAMRDKGTLVVSDRGAEFTGGRGRVVITDVKRVHFGKQGRDVVNNWVRIDYGDGRMAFFADGSGLGWGGVLGGTRRILEAMLPLQSLAPVMAPAPMAPLWAPTHLVPEGGIDAWDAQGDPSRPPIGRLFGHLELVVESSNGVWALVRDINGWRGWVDVRLLVVRQQEGEGRRGTMFA
jgi:hypothetical protein